MAPEFSEIRDAVVNGNKKQVVDLVQEAVQTTDPMSIIDGALAKGLEVVGSKFEEGEFFLPDMMLAAQAMEAAINILEPMLQKGSQTTLGKIVIGTVEGDIHEIGKNIVILILKSAGFEVFDLGVNVPSARFIEAVKERGAQILGISALMTTTIAKQKEIIDMLAAEGLRDKVKVMVGGAPITPEWAERIGADSYSPDAIVAVREAKRLQGFQ